MSHVRVITSWPRADDVARAAADEGRLSALRARGAHLTELSAVLRARGAAPRTATGVSSFHPPSYSSVPPVAFTYLIDSDAAPPIEKWLNPWPRESRTRMNWDLILYILLAAVAAKKYIYKIYIF